MKQPTHNSFLLLSHLSPEWNQSHVWPRGASQLGEMSSLPHLHHAYGSPKAEEGQGQGSPTPGFLTGDHHSSPSLPPTHPTLRRDSRQLRTVWGFPGTLWRTRLLERHLPSILFPGEEGVTCTENRQFDT